MCKLKEKRNVFNLFNIYDCKKCTYYKKDETIVIGLNQINIYYLFSDCKKKDVNELRYLVNIKLKRILYDYLFNSATDLLLWLDKEENLEELEQVLTCFFPYYKVIHIIYK